MFYKNVATSETGVLENFTTGLTTLISDLWIFGSPYKRGTQGLLDISLREAFCSIKIHCKF